MQERKTKTFELNTCLQVLFSVENLVEEIELVKAQN